MLRTLKSKILSYIIGINNYEPIYKPILVRIYWYFTVFRFHLSDLVFSGFLWSD
jgi:hypothetical protein